MSTFDGEDQVKKSQMELEVDDQLKEICSSIVERSLNESEWAAQESDDEYQSSNYCGGFDADENAFCFSFYSITGHEYWFQFTLEEASLIKSGAMKAIQSREAE